MVHGVEGDAGRRMRRLRAPMDTGDPEPAELPLEEVPLNAMEQGRGRRQDAGGTDQGREKPQDNSEQEPMMHRIECLTVGTRLYTKSVRSSQCPLWRGKPNCIAHGGLSLHEHRHKPESRTIPRSDAIWQALKLRANERIKQHQLWRFCQ